MTLLVKLLDRITPAAVACAFAGSPYLLWLDSADERHPDALWSYVMADPMEVIEGRGAGLFETLRERLRDDVSGVCPAPFSGGAAGLFSYDLGRNLEELPTTSFDNPAIPDMAVGVYTQVFAYNHRDKQGWVITRGEDAQAREEAFLRQLERATSYPSDCENLDFTPALSPATYQARVRKVIDYIHEGDIFQANLSQRFEADLPLGFDPLAHYLALRQNNPSPFGGYFDTGSLQIASCSPERFLTLKDGCVETKPIKGTAPRSSDPVRDKINAEILLASVKDRAENIMIVDLLRNDLSKVCQAESVEVEKLCELESFAKVHHLVSTVRGKLQEGYDAIDLLKACFPGGSITGAPKIRAMEIIEELEDVRRGPYTGSLGYIGFDGTMDTNILIRSIIYADGKASLNVGGGITAQSEPEAEYQETLDKAAGLIYPSLRAERSNPRDCRVALKGSSQ